MSRYYNPEIARFISEDTYRGELNDPLSLNRYVYVNNNPLIYYDPNGYFLKEILEGIKYTGVKAAEVAYGAGKYVGTRAVALVQATGELAYDTIVGTATLAWNTGELVGSTIGLEGNEIAHQLGLTSEETYRSLQNAYGNNFLRSGQTLASLPSNMVNGVVTNFQTTFNWDNFTNYLTTNDYNEMKDYSKSAVQTGLTIYGGYKLVKGGYNWVDNKINGPVNNSWYDQNGNMQYPVNKGAIPGSKETVTLQEGQELARYGEINETSRFVTKPGVSPDSISLPPNQNTNIYQEFKVIKPITDVTQSTAAPWGGSSGGGIQYNLPNPIKWYLNNGYIK